MKDRTEDILRSFGVCDVQLAVQRLGKLPAQGCLSRAAWITRAINLATGMGRPYTMALTRALEARL